MKNMIIFQVLKGPTRLPKFQGHVSNNTYNFKGPTGFNHPQKKKKKKNIAD